MDGRWWVDGGMEGLRELSQIPLLQPCLIFSLPRSGSPRMKSVTSPQHSGCRWPGLASVSCLPPDVLAVMLASSTLP